MKQRASTITAVSFVLRARLWLSLVLVGLFAIIPVYAAYVPDGSFQPVWAGGDGEPASGPDWNDDEGDSVPNWLEEYYGTTRWQADTDGDGLSDWDEIFTTGSDPVLWDTDGNGLSDADDLFQPPDAGDTLGGAPAADDMDGDGLPDLWELAYAFDAYDPADAFYDPDGDGLTNLDECLYGTDPNTWDDATTVTGSNSGGDDNGDGEPDTTADEDQDGLPDAWELANGLDPTDPGDIADDPDGDFIFNIEEHQNGTDPQTPDDFWAVMGYPIDPVSLTRQDDGTERDADWDGDGVSNTTEIAYGTDPRSPDDNQSSGPSTEADDAQNNSDQSQQNDTGVEIDVEVEYTMETTVTEMRREDEQAYQAAVIELWERYGGITLIPQQELDHLDELYPLCEHAQTYSRNQRETFKMYEQIARTEAVVYAAVVGWIAELPQVVNWTIRGWTAWNG